MPAQTHYWVCMHCGKEYKKTTSLPNPPPPPSSALGKCPATPTGKHVMIKQQ